MMKRASVAIVCAAGIWIMTGCFPDAYYHRHHHRRRDSRWDEYRATVRNPYRPLGIISGDRVRVGNTVPKDPLLILLRKYSPEAYHLVRRTERMQGTISVGSGYRILKQGHGRRITTVNGVRTVVRLTNTGFRKWIRSTDRFESQLKDMTTAVHELYHGHTHRNVPFLLSRRLSVTDPIKVRFRRWLKVMRYDTLYLDRRTILYSLTRSSDYRASFYAAPPANVLVDTVPQSRRTFRWKTYVSGTRYQSTIANGISGLLDEYAAYYWSTKVACDFYDYYRIEKGGSPSVMRDWVSWVSLYYFAWAEFRYWILEYLAYTEEHHPAIWRSFLADRRLREAFTAIDDRFTAQIALYFRRMTRDIPALMRVRGKRVSIRPYTYFRPGRRRKKKISYSVGNHSTSLMSHDFFPLQEEMARPRLTRMANRFRLRPQGTLPALLYPEKRVYLTK